MRPVHPLRSFTVVPTVTACAALAACLLFAGRLQAQETPDVQNAQVDEASLRKEVEKLRNEKEYEAKRVEEMRQEREELVKQIRRSENQNAKLTKELDEMRAALSQQQGAFETRMTKLESDLKDSQSLASRKAPVVAAPAAEAPEIAPLEVEKKANEVLQKGGDIDPEDEKFKEELARAHYNMGNVYFERGEHQRAVVEYYQAVDLMPYDADAHYNLAFVSGQYVGDQDTALKHYQWYLYLKPNAPDRKLVEEKIVNAKLAIRSRVQAKIDNPEVLGHMNEAR